MWHRRQRERDENIARSAKRKAAEVGCCAVVDQPQLLLFCMTGSSACIGVQSAACLLDVRHHDYLYTTACSCPRPRSSVFCWCACTLLPVQDVAPARQGKGDKQQRKAAKARRADADMPAAPPAAAPNGVVGGGIKVAYRRVVTEGKEHTESSGGGGEEEAEAYQEQTHVSPLEEVSALPEFLLPDDALLKPVTRAEDPVLLVVPAKGHAAQQQQQPAPDSNGNEAAHMQAADKAEAQQDEAVRVSLHDGRCHLID